ncbi:MAG: PIN domain-containing protein [Acidobacteriota bacterium]
MKLLLDTNIVTRLCHPARQGNQPVAAWVSALLETQEHRVCVPEIADYEVRRGLTHVALKSGRSTSKSLQRLDLLSETLDYLPINTPTMKRAAALWADARHAGLPTAAGNALDGDVIIAAQALEIGGLVVTENLKHISRFVEAYRWQEAPVGLK